MSTVPQLFIYTKPGCGLCREALEALDGVIAGRRALALPLPAIVERDILTDPEWERAFFDKIPVVEFGDRRLELVTGAARLRRLLADVLDVDGGLPPVEVAPLGG